MKLEEGDVILVKRLNRPGGIISCEEYFFSFSEVWLPQMRSADAVRFWMCYASSLLLCRLVLVSIFGIEY